MGGSLEKVAFSMSSSPGPSPPFSRFGETSCDEKIITVRLMCMRTILAHT